jgi:hypothetical protein
MKKCLPAFLLLLASACSTPALFSGEAYVLRIAPARIEAKMNAGLPLTQAYALFQVTLANARLSLKEGSERIGVGLDIALGVMDFAQRDETPLFGGSVDISGSIRYDDAQGAFYLDSPVLESIRVTGFPARRFERARIILSRILEEYYLRHPLYVLDEQNIQQAALRKTLKRVAVENAELVAVFGR